MRFLPYKPEQTPPSDLSRPQFDARGSKSSSVVMVMALYRLR
jgi:hypothetical protein